MVACLSLVLAATQQAEVRIDLPNGDLQTSVSLLAEAMKEDVTAYADSIRTPSITLTSKEDDAGRRRADLLAQFASRMNMERPDDELAAFGSLDLPYWLVHRYQGDEWHRQELAFPKIKTDRLAPDQEGRFSVTTKAGEWLMPLQLEKVKFEKPVRVHWFFHYLPLAVAWTDVDQRTALRAAAAALGAKFVERKEDFLLDLDPSIYKRKRATLYLSEINATDDPVRVACLKMEQAAVLDVPGEAIVQAFASPEGSSRGLIPAGRPFFQFAKDALAAFLQRYDPKNARVREKDPGMTTFADLVREKADPDRSVEVGLSARGAVDWRLRCKDEPRGIILFHY